MNQYGGEILGSGTYGCVLKPSIRCRKFNEKKPDSPGPEIGNQPDDVAKFMNSDAAREELKEMKKIAEIDPQNVFTLPMAEYCEVSYRRQTEEVQKDMRDCRSVNHRDITGALIMKDGGISLSEKSRNIRQYYDERNDNDKFNKFLSGLWRVFYGLYTINKNGYIHNDIKSVNIMVKEVNDEMRFNIIDFGIMQKKGEAEYLGYYFAFPVTTDSMNFSYSIFGDMYNPTSMKKRINSMVKKYNYSLSYAGNIMQKFLKRRGDKFYGITGRRYVIYENKIKEDLTQYMNNIRQYIENHNEGISLSNLRKYLNRVYCEALDMYSFGLVLADIVNVLPVTDMFIPLERLIYDMINVNDFERIRPEEALDRYEAFLRANDISFPRRVYDKPSPKKSSAKKSSPKKSGSKERISRNTQRRSSPKAVAGAGAPPTRSPVKRTTSKTRKASCKGLSLSECGARSDCLVARGKKRTYCRNRTNKRKTSKK
jgi:serine/threonine protein kinase